MSINLNEMVVTDIKIPFWSMVVLMVKWALASIPAVIILIMIAAAFSMALGWLFGIPFDWHGWSGGRMMTM
jgi:hypothetical protein